MSDMKAATVWWCLEGLLSPEEIVQVSVQTGYSGIELAPPAEWSRISEAGLAIVSHRGHDALTDGLNDRRNHDRIERQLLDNIALAQQWQRPILICFSGNRNGLDDETGAINTADGLRRVAGTESCSCRAAATRFGDTPNGPRCGVIRSMPMTP